MDREKIVHLEIRSFRGISIGATHYYGELKGHVDGHYKSVDLEYAMTAQQAKALTKKDFEERGYQRMRYSPGDMYAGFDTMDDVRAEAIRQYKTHFPKAEMLVEGHAAYYERKPVLDPPDMGKVLI